MYCLPLRTPAARLSAIAAFGLMLFLSATGGCAQKPLSDDHPLLATGARLDAVNLDNAESPGIIEGPVSLRAAKNEWTSFTLRLSDLPHADANTRLILRVQPLQFTTTNASIPASSFSAYQVLPMPVDLNRAGYVRHTGLSVGAGQLPRALLPIPMDNGAVNVSALRDPDRATDPQSRLSGKTAQPALVWIDLHVPIEARAGDYATTCDLMVSGNPRPVASVPLKLTVHDFVLPEERHLLMVSQLSWDRLEKLNQDQFEAVTPNLINRRDARYARAVKTLDDLVKLAEANRTEVVVPRLQPTAKWPAAAPPEVDWSNFDSLVDPWMSGNAFADKTPLGYWPVPPVEGLGNFDPESQRQYWAAAGTHFSQRDWINRSAVFLEKGTPGRAGSGESIQLSADASHILAAHPALRVTVPLEDDQVQLASSNNPGIDPATTDRLVTASPGLIFAPPTQAWPTDAKVPQHWLRTDLPGLVPYVGAGGDERDVRLWAWLAFLPPKAGLILWTGALPSQDNAQQAADPSELIWFYPGSWFGVDGPVPSIQLKWLRRAQQDYEYLWLASERGQRINALLMARLMTKPVQIQPGQAPDPTYGLMCGTTEQDVWDQAQDLLARTILLREPGTKPDLEQERALNHDMIRWIVPKQRPFIIPRTARWLWDKMRDGGNGNLVAVRLGIDIYNASDNPPDQNQLAWSGEARGWQVRPQPVNIGSLHTYRVQRFELDGRFDLSKVADDSRTPIEVTFIDGDTREKYKAQASLPVAACDRREADLKLDGSLNDWDTADAIQDGPMVKMLDRPTLHEQENESAKSAVRGDPHVQTLRTASVPAQVFTGWSDENLYVAFKLSGMASNEIHFMRNFVDYQFRRAWGEDLCQILVQPVYDDNTLGPVTHVVCKPSGNWVERKLGPSESVAEWVPYQGGTGIRYAATLDNGIWRGEVAIPWTAIDDPQHGRPHLLRFNFAQHNDKTGETASWAGPIDFGRDDSFMGLLVLREPVTPGFHSDRP